MGSSDWESKRKCGPLANAIFLFLPQTRTDGMNHQERRRTKGLQNDPLYIYSNKCLIFAFSKSIRPISHSGSFRAPILQTSHPTDYAYEAAGAREQLAQATGVGV
jgi:hypothetical protein